MRRLPPTFSTLLLAHLLASYCTYVPALLMPLLNPGFHLPPNEWIYVSLAPLLAPIYLTTMTVLTFPHYYPALPQAWACYTVPFLIICLIRRRNTPVLKLALPPILATLLVTAVWLPHAMADLSRRHNPLEGKPAPDFSLPTLAGVPHTLSSEKGHVVLIDFWATSCPPCCQELKQTISKLAADPALHARGLRVWTIDAWEDADTARQFMDQNHYTFDVLLDPKRSATKLYRSDGLPSTFLVGRDGSIRRVFSGFYADTDARLQREINDALD